MTPAVSVVAKNFVYRPNIGPKHFDILKPEPGSKSGSSKKA